MAKRTAVTVTTDTSGNAVVTTPPLGGRVLHIDFGKGFDNTADITIVGATSGIKILAVTNKADAAIAYTPRRVVNLSTTGAEVAAWDHIWLDKAGEALTITITQGGSEKSEVVTIVTDE